MVDEASEDVPFDTKGPVFKFGYGLRLNRKCQSEEGNRNCQISGVFSYFYGRSRRKLALFKSRDECTICTIRFRAFLVLHFFRILNNSEQLRTHTLLFLVVRFVTFYANDSANLIKSRSAVRFCNTKPIFVGCSQIE